jgi:hypothetical protein
MQTIAQLRRTHLEAVTLANSPDLKPMLDNDGNVAASVEELRRSYRRLADKTRDEIANREKLVARLDAAPRQTGLRGYEQFVEKQEANA